MAVAKRGTCQFSKDFFSPEERQAMAEAGINKPKAAAEVKRSTTGELEKYRGVFKARVKRASEGWAEKADGNFEYEPANSFAAFLADAEEFGFHNFKTGVLCGSWIKEFNRFLEANMHIIQSGILDFANIPVDWLDKRDKKNPLPGVGRKPEASSLKMLEMLASSEYQLVLNANDEIPSNYYSWLSVFDALKLVEQYRKEKAGRK